ncbi:uncharacterized protein B0H18DRAFT_1106454 [Fomitopsis serialis]|uniref:uncharacterized protein n=1 Tax=Fomitopsis serialis TaxID=139415 RepID=UPI002008E6C5|nr:uncharacterized protein B0H18DRAFT_1106454 [Neoantrodia serialis]KAH9919938.1 hypothetical protein B0H18DRAFT_1106454 [Neoantrodia serialis]
MQYAGDAADAKRDNKENMASWQREIHDRIKEYPDNINRSLQLIQVGNLENAMYGPLMKALERMVRPFPHRKRPKFHNYEHKVMKFPFEPYEHDQHPTKPDVIATFPTLPFISPLHRWRHVALVFELKSLASADPMIMNMQTHWETLVQLAKSARNIMLSQGRLFAFVVGIYGDQARIFRFDRAGAICSPKFAYKNHPEILHAFMWRLFHPRDRRCAIVGEDPTMKLGTSMDRKLADKLASRTRRKADDVPRIQADLRELWTVFPRTLIWEAFIVDKRNRSTGERYILKETWRQLGRLDEVGFYERLQETCGGGTGLGEARFTYGVARYICGEDYGERDEAHRKLVSRQRPLELLCPRTRRRVTGRSLGCIMRLRRCTREVVLALRDAVEGHRRAYEAGIIHRDVSEGNVMISRLHSAFAASSRLRLQLQLATVLAKRGWDVDLTTWRSTASNMGTNRADRWKSDLRTTAKSVRNVALHGCSSVEGEITHEARHDLESFYWLLVFIVLGIQHGHHKKVGLRKLVLPRRLDQRASTRWLLTPQAPLPVLVTSLDDLWKFRNLLRNSLSLDPSSIEGQARDDGYEGSHHCCRLSVPHPRNPPPQAAPEYEQSDNEQDGSKTPDHSDDEDASVMLAQEPSDEEVVTDIDERPNAPDAPHGLALLDEEPQQPEANASESPEQTDPQTRASSRRRAQSPQGKASGSVEATGYWSRDSSIGKRSREGSDQDEVEESLAAQSSKRPRTVSQPRGRKASKKSEKKKL